jgi:hypothetical protein
MIVAVSAAALVAARRNADSDVMAPRAVDAEPWNRVGVVLSRGGRGWVA